MFYLSLLIVVYIAGEMNASLPTHLPNKIHVMVAPFKSRQKTTQNLHLL